MLAEGRRTDQKLDAISSPRRLTDENATREQDDRQTGNRVGSSAPSLRGGRLLAGSERSSPVSMHSVFLVQIQPVDHAQDDARIGHVLVEAFVRNRQERRPSRRAHSVEISSG